MSNDPFCNIAAGTGPAAVLREWDDALAFLPHKPVLEDGHFLVIPRTHVPDALADPAVTGMVMTRTAELTREFGWTDANLAFNVGVHGGQTVGHLHAHSVRADELNRHTMPWFGQQLKDGREFFVGADAAGDLTLWTGDRAQPTRVAAKHQLDDMDPLLWSALVGVLRPSPVDEDLS